MSDSKLVVDSAATSHTFKGKVLFSNLREVQGKIRVGTKQFVPYFGKGVVKITVGDRSVIFKDALYAPGLLANLISVPACTKQGIGVFFEADTSQYKIYIKEEMILQVPLSHQDLWCVDVNDREIDQSGLISSKSQANDRLKVKN